MNPLGPILAVAAVLVAAAASRRRTNVAVVTTAVLAIFATTMLWPQQVSAARGFLIEPVRAIGALAVVAAAVLLSFAGGVGRRRLGIVAAGAVLALTGGHGVVVLVGLLATTAGVLLLAWGSRPATVHASVPVRVAGPILLVADVFVCVALLFADERMLEPVRVTGGVAVTGVLIAVVLRLAVMLVLRTPLAVLSIGVATLSISSWLEVDALGPVRIAAGIVAVAGAWRAARTSDQAAAVASLTALAVGGVALGVGGAAALLVLAAAVGWVVLPGHAPGLVMFASAAPGLALGGAGSVIAEGVSRVGAATGQLVVVLVLALLLVASFGIVPARTDRRPAARVSAAIVATGLLVIAITAAPMLAALRRLVLVARAPETLVLSGAAVPTWAPVAAFAVVVLWALFEIASTGVAVRPAGSGSVTTARSDDALVVPDAAWLRVVRILAIMAAAATLLVFVRSAMRGWL